MSDLISRQAAVEAFRKELCKEREHAISFKGCESMLNGLPTVKPIKMMCNGEHIKCPAHKDYERGYKDGQAEAQMKAEPVTHGRWEQVEVVHDRKDAKIQDWQQAKCSVCGKWHTTPFMYYLKLDNYCPNCGAQMIDEGEE